MRFLCRKPRDWRALSNLRTYYEAGLIGPDGQPVAILAYDQKHTRRALLQAAYHHGPAIAELANVDPANCAITWNARTQRWAVDESGFSIGWTGSTEYQRAAEALHAVA